MASLFGGIGGGSSSGGGDDRGLLGQLTPLAATSSGYKYTPAIGTGILPFINWARDQGLLTPVTINAVVPNLPGLFGGYPDAKKTEIGPDGLFMALFAILFLVNISMWLVNVMRKQYFHMQLGLAFFCILKVIGFACRLVWARDIPDLRTAICSVVFIQVAQLVLLALNMILAHRIFTWRHPETGRSFIVVHFLNFVYFMVIMIIVMAILGQSLPYIYFMTEHHYNMCKNVFKAAAVFNLFFATMPLQLIAVAYVLKPGTIIKLPKVLNRLTGQTERALPPVYQATWIKSAGLFYYPEKNSQIPVYKGEPGSDAIRIIPSREPPSHRESHGDPMHPLSPKLRIAIATVVTTSILLLFNTCFRAAACFRNGSYADATYKIHFWAHHPYVMFIFYGAFEVVVLSIYLLMRIDLRFYIPDMPKKVPKGGAPLRQLATRDRPIAWEPGTGPEDVYSRGNVPEGQVVTDPEKEGYSHDSGSYDRV